MRSFLTRLVASVAPSLLLAPCIAICVACATPFPLDNLEEGMTMAEATEAFGEPSSKSVEELYQEVQLLLKQNARIYESLKSAVDLSGTRGPVARKLEQLSTRTLRTLERLVAELNEANSERDVRSTWVYPHEEEVSAWRIALAIFAPVPMEKQQVELLFDGNELVSWETRPAPVVPTSAYGYQNTTGTYGYPFPSTNTWVPAPKHKHHSGGGNAPSPPPSRPTRTPQHTHENGPRLPAAPR